MITNNKTFLTKKRHILLLVAIVSIILGTGGHLYFSHSLRQLRLEKENELKAIAELKINQISEWYLDELGDAELLSENNYLHTTLEKYLSTKSNIDKNSLKILITQIEKEHSYKDIIITTPSGTPLFATTESLFIIDTLLINSITQAVQEKKTVCSDIYKCSVHNELQIDFISPVYDSKKFVIAVIIFRHDPNKFLYPLIKSWPTPSKSSETLLLKKDGDNVLYLNELRHQSNTALKLRLPLTRKNLPAVQAILGKTGIFEGKDYRGVNVLAFLNPVPGTNWFMVSKVDTDEIFADIYFLNIIAFIVIFSLILSLSIGFVWIYYYQQRNIYKNLWETQEEFSATLQSIGDAVISTDGEGKIKFLNPVAEQLTGWSNADANGKKLENVFKIINEETKNIVDNPVERVLKDGLIVGLANHTLLISKDGKEIPIADSGAPIRNEKGEIVGVVLVFRDQTEERAQLKALRENEEKFRKTILNLDEGYYCATLDGILIEHNLAFNRILGFEKTKDLKGLRLPDFWQDVEDRKKYLDILLNKGSIVNYQINAKTQKGEKIVVIASAHIVKDAENRPVRIEGIFLDITERKRMEEKVNRQGELLQNIIDNIPVMIAYFNDEGKIQFANRELVNKLGWSLKEWQTENILAKCYPEPEAFKEALDFMINKPACWKDFKTTTKYGTVLDTTWTNILIPNGFSIGIGQDITERKRVEEALKESEKNLLYAQKIGLIGSWKLDIQTQNLQWSDTVFEIFEIDKIKFGASYKTFLETVHPDDRELVDKAYTSSLKNKTPYEIEHRLLMKDGRIKWVNEICRTEYDSQGKPLYSLGIVQDITVRKRAESQLLLQNAALEASANAIVIANGEGFIQWANPAFTKLTGFVVPDEVFGRNPRDLVKSGKQDKQFYKNLWNTILSGKVWHGELINRRKDGSLYDEEMTITPVTNVTGEITHFIAVKQNITERKRAEEELRCAQEQYKSFFDEDLTGDFISTPAGNIITCNPAFASIFGFSSIDEAKSVNVDTLYYNQNDRIVLLERLRSEKIVRYIELEMKRRDETPVYIVANLSGIFNDQGELVQIKGYLFDDTKRRTLEHQLIQAQKLESLGTLAAGIAHDFNNILAIIIGHVSIFERLPATPEMLKKNTDAIMKAAMRGADLVKQMLTFARKTDVRFEPVLLNNTVKEVSKLLNETFPKTIIVSLHLEEKLLLIDADATQVHQVLLNLCVNARDAMPDGGNLTITTRRESGSVLRDKYVSATASDYCVLSVADTGMGMDEETQLRIFDPFFTTKELGKGTGLGLSLVFGIMESHKGFVTVESKLGIGTTFHCYFPMRQKTVEFTPLEKQSTENILGGNETILVVEDEEMLRELVKSVLELKGYTVLAAEDGEEGLAIFKQYQDKIELVLSDLGLPKFTGDELYRKLKMLKPDVLFIIASGFIEPEMKLEIFSLGIKQFIQKPYNMNEVLRIIRDLFDNQQRAIDSE